MINDFRKEFRWLSNFHEEPVTFEGVTYPTNEHAYQAAKSTDSAYREAQLNTLKPADSRRLGQTCALRPDWDIVKFSVMHDLNVQKYKNPELRAALLATGDLYLKEGNYWHDNVWGSCWCEKCGDKGKNMLGEILMHIRYEIKAGRM